MRRKKTKNPWPRLTQCRKDRGMTMAALADWADIGVSQVSDYEAGKRQPGIDSLTQIAIALNVSTDYLNGRCDDMSLYSEYDRPSFEVALSKMKAFGEVKEIKVSKNTFERIKYHYFPKTRSEVRSIIFNSVVIKK